MEVIPLSEPTTGPEAPSSQTLPTGSAQTDSRSRGPKEDGTAQQIMQLLQEIQNPQALRSPPFLGENPCIPFFYRPDEQDEVKILVVWGVGVTEAGVLSCVCVRDNGHVLKSGEYWTPQFTIFEAYLSYSQTLGKLVTDVWNIKKPPLCSVCSLWCVHSLKNWRVCCFYVLLSFLMLFPEMR